jgi:(+)-abscisic acid 8'-hydroxylase
MAFFFVFLFAAVCILVSLAVLLSRQKRMGAIGRDQELMLPPGSMGLPYLGETLHMYSQNPSVFFASKQTRYGYNCSITGCNLTIYTITRK